MSRVRRAVHRRLNGGADDEGFVMIYVLMVIMIITVLVGGTLVVTSANVLPAVTSTYDMAAESAAQAGLNAFVAYANTQCADGSHSTVSTCTLASNLSGNPIGSPTNIYSASGYTSSFIWKADKDSQGRYFRVTSTGTVKQGGLSANRTLIADIASGASSNPLDFGVITGYETESPNDILAHYQRRVIGFDATGVNNATVPIKNNSVTWSGGSPGAAAGKVAVCNATINQKGGRGNNPPAKAPNPYVDWTEDSIQGNHYTNFEPCQTSWGHSSELLAPANAADGAGGYFTQDAMLLSNSYPGGTGPLFNQPVTTTFTYTSDDATVCGTAPGQNYRSFSLSCAGYPLEVGGSPSPSSTYGAPQVGPGPTISTSDVTVPSTACMYAGPTRVKLNGSQATITSPQTTAAWVAASASGHPAQCYVGAGAFGMAAQTVDLTGISVISAQNLSAPPVTPAIAHGSSGWNVTGQYHGATAASSNSVFWMTNGTAGTTTNTVYTGSAPDVPYTPAVGDNPSTKPGGDKGWTPQWTSFTAGTTCSTATAVTDLKFFNCYQSGGTYSATAYSALKAKVQLALSTSASSYNSIGTLQSYLNTLVSAGNSSDANNSSPSHSDNTSHRWKVTVAQDASATDGCTPGTSSSGPVNTPISAPSSDPFFNNVAGNSAATIGTTTTCLTATVSLQIPTCTLSLLSLCINIGSYAWGNGALLGSGGSVPQFKVTTTNVATATTTTVTSAVSSFPNMDDVTQYSIGTNGAFGADGPGDLYVEGTPSSTLALHAQDDVVVTGTLAPAGGLVDAQTPVQNPTSAIEVIGQNNVRIYHPVKCVVTTAALIDPSVTSPGWCPDDITGLYSGVLPNGARPDQQYTNMRPDLANLTIDAVVFALGNAPQKITCPEPPGGNAQCGGEFVVDNYSRGDSVGTSPLGYVTVIGTLAMAHHAPVGEEWEVSDVAGQSSRPYSGYQFAERYQNVKSLLAANGSVSGLVPTGPNTPTPWHIISVSAGTP